MGIEEKPTRLIFNKIDRVEDGNELERLGRIYPGALFTNAVEGEGLEEIRRAICALVESKEEILSITVPYSEGRLMSTVYQMGEVLSTQDGEEATEMKVRVSKANGDRLRKLGVATEESER